MIDLGSDKRLHPHILTAPVFWRMLRVGHLSRLLHEVEMAGDKRRSELVTGHAYGLPTPEVRDRIGADIRLCAVAQEIECIGSNDDIVFDDDERLAFGPE